MVVIEGPQEIVKSTANSSKEIGSGHAFRGYHYAMGAAKVTEDELCFDTGCSITLVDRAWLKQVCLGSNKHQTSEYAIFPRLLPGRDKTGKRVTAMTAPREVHIVT